MPTHTSTDEGEDHAVPHRPLGGLRGLAMRSLEPWIPEARLAAGGESLRSARIVVGFTFVLLLLAFETWVFFHWALPADATGLLDASLVVAVVLVLMVPAALRRSASSALAANLVMAASLLVMLSVFVLLGGIRAPVLHWCALVPMLAVLMGARRAAWVWGGMVFLTLAGFAFVELADLSLPAHLDASELLGERMWIQRLVDVGSWVAILFAVASIYESNKDHQTAELGEANAELEREIGQRRRAEERTRYLAYHDELTQLPNRQFFQEQLRAAVVQAERDGRLVAVLFLDLDGFKEVNDTYGHRLGDVLLKEVAERLRSCVRNADSVFHGDSDAQAEDGEAMVSRLGGDEFTVLLVRLRNEGEAGIVARRMLNALERVFSIDGQQIRISASIGIAQYPGPIGDVEALLKNADLAMYSAKSQGRNNYQFFRESMNEEIVQRTTVANELREALERGEFVLQYQPIVDARSHAIVKFEALIRWQHRTRGLLLPGAFIGIAEDTGLIVPITEDILQRACQQNRRWQQAGLPAIPVAVNLSGVHLRHGNLAAHVAAVLSESGLDASYLELEITESAVMEDEVEAGLVLTELKELGLRIALDDFGTGYSSLSYIHRYPVDSIKIDRSFVQNVVIDSDSQAITTAIVAMAHGLQLKVVAEGVETEAQELFLRGLGCDYLQGYRFSVPGSPEEAEQLLRTGVSPADVG